VEQLKVCSYWGYHFIFFSKLLFKFFIVILSCCVFCMYACFVNLFVVYVLLLYVCPGLH